MYLYELYPRVECGRVCGCNLRKKLRLDHQSLHAAAAAQCYTICCCPLSQCKAAASVQVQSCCRRACASARLLLLHLHMQQQHHAAEEACSSPKSCYASRRTFEDCEELLFKNISCWEDFCAESSFMQSLLSTRVTWVFLLISCFKFFSGFCLVISLNISRCDSIFKRDFQHSLIHSFSKLLICTVSLAWLPKWDLIWLQIQDLIHQQIFILFFCLFIRFLSLLYLLFFNAAYPRRAIFLVLVLPV